MTLPKRNAPPHEAGRFFLPPDPFNCLRSRRKILRSEILDRPTPIPYTRRTGATGPAKNRPLAQGTQPDPERRVLEVPHPSRRGGASQSHAVGLSGPSVMTPTPVGEIVDLLYLDKCGDRLAQAGGRAGGDDRLPARRGRLAGPLRAPPLPGGGPDPLRHPEAPGRALRCGRPAADRTDQKRHRGPESRLPGAPFPGRSGG